MTDFSDSDFDALEAAVMETPRGRWFLGQYARRARAGDTQVMLDAIRKLENSLPGLHPAGGSAELVGELDAISQALATAVRDVAALPVAEPEGSIAGDSGKIHALSRQLEAIKGRIDALIGEKRPRTETALTHDNLSYFDGDEDLFDRAGAADRAPGASSLSLVDSEAPSQRPTLPQPMAVAAEPDAGKERIMFIRHASSDQTTIPLADEPADEPADQPAEARRDSRPAHGG